MYAGKQLAFAFLLLFLSLPDVHAQKTKSQIQKDKQEQLNKIKNIERILSETANRKKNTIGELSALSQQIQEQEKLIAVLKEEISLLNAEIDENNEIIDALENDLKNLKEEYAKMIFAAQKANNSITRLTFLFSAESFTQFIMRLQYMRQYGETRKNQMEVIARVQATLEGQVRDVEKRRAEKSTLLQQEQKESNDLQALRKKQTSLIGTLEKQERTLKKDIEDTKKAIAELDKMLEEIIREEAARAARAGSAAGSSALSSSFENNRAKFDWPVQGFISQKFGKHPHPVLKHIVEDHKEIKIRTKENEVVHSIFEGQVVSVAVFPPFGITVIIQHGTYYTVYSGLKDVHVKLNQKVTTNQPIGTVKTNADGVAELLFRINKQTTVINPEPWLKPK